MATSHTLSVRTEHYLSDAMQERDKVLLQAFGFGYDRDVTTRVVVALLRDLSGLSAEHQQIWRAHEVTGDYLPHPDFWGPVLGHWPERESIFRAFIEEFRQINTMCRLMGHPPLFREDFTSTAVPNEFG